MATPSLTATALPAEADLRAFATAAAHLLVDRQPRTPGARTVSRRAGVGIQHFDHRDYAPGDEVRHIDWRQTARRRQPIVRRFEAESVSDWTLLLDASSSMACPGAAKWQAAACLAAGLAYALLQAGHRVGLVVFGARVLWHCPRGRGQPHYAAIAGRLATLQPRAAGERSDLGACVGHLHGAGSVFALSDFLADDEMRRDLGATLQRCTSLHALQVSDAAETRLSSTQELDLEDAETGARWPWHGGAQANALATAERAAMTARLRSFCIHHGAAFSHWDITQPWQQALAQRALAMLDVDPLGLDLMDRKLLDAVIQRFDGGPVGLDNVAAAIGEEAGTIEDVIEPYLIQQGYLQRTPRGRIATQAAYRHLGLAPPPSSGAGDLFDR